MEIKTTIILILGNLGFAIINYINENYAFAMFSIFVVGVLFSNVIEYVIRKLF